MKILCFIDSLGSGGAQRQMIELAKAFKLKGCKVSFLTYHENNFFKPELDEYNISVKTIIEPNYIKRLFKIRRAIRNHKPDAVLSFLEGANFMATLAGFPIRKWRLVVGERSANQRIVKNLKLRLFRKAHFFTDFIVGNSNKNIELVKKIIPLINKNKLKVIYNSVQIPDNNNFFIIESAITKIVVAASYRETKNLDGLIEAIFLLPDEYKLKLQINWFGHITTDNKYYETQLNKIKKNNLGGVIVLNNHTNQIYEKYQKADFVGLFSHYEGFPNAICEAMARCKPIIVSKVSDVPIFIKENENGFLCDSHDPKSIMEALIKAIDSSYLKRKYIGENNREIVSLYFDSEVIVNQYLELLK
jgi:glycosyltransferase involved in cell wall biosynthesis